MKRTLTCIKKKRKKIVASINSKSEFTPVLLLGTWKQLCFLITNGQLMPTQKNGISIKFNLN